MNWIKAGEDMVVNLDEIKAIERASNNQSEIFTSAKESFIAPIDFESLRAKVLNQTKSIQNSMRSLALGQRTFVP